MTATQKKVVVEMTENEMKDLVRNALMIAGQEMGETGDHWPVIKNTITDVMRDWEELDIERAFQDEMKKHLYQQLEAMEDLLSTCDPSMKEEVAPKLREVRNIYDAHFTKTEYDFVDMTEVDPATLPLHVRRAHKIISTLEEPND